jgi:urea transport system permease protein
MFLNFPFWTRCLFALLLVLPLQAVSAADLLDRQVLAGLAGDSNDEKVNSITALGQLSTPGAAKLLAALANGSVLIASDGTVLLSVGNNQVLNPSTGETSTTPSGAQAFTLNNRLRRALQSAQISSELFSSNRSVRLAAAARLQKEADASRAPMIERALQTEKDPQVKQALDTALASAAIKSDDPKLRLKAVVTLGDSKSAIFKSQLLAMVTPTPDGKFTETDPQIRAAAKTSLAQIERQELIVSWVGNIFFGLSLGSVLLLAALGLAITFGLMGVINMAHGELLMIGAYATYVVQGLFKQWLPEWIDWYVLAALPVAFFVTALVGMALERTVIRWLYGRPLETLLATWGISLMLMQGVRSIFGAQNVEVANPSWMSGGLTLLGTLTLSYNRIVIVGFALCVVVAVWFVLNFTRLGLFVRAITQNRRMADCVGVPTGRVDMLAFGLGSGIAGLAGVALSQLGNVGPDLGRSYIVDSFMVVVLGGVGQLAGTVVAAMGLGALNKIIEPFWGAVIAKIAILLFIVLFVQKRPQGLFAPKGRSAE